MRDFLRLLTGRIAFERKARLLAAQLGAQWAAERRASGYTACDALDEAERFYFFLLEGESPESFRQRSENERYKAEQKARRDLVEA